MEISLPLPTGSVETFFPACKRSEIYIVLIQPFGMMIQPLFMGIRSLFADLHALVQLAGVKDNNPQGCNRTTDRHPR